MSHQPKKPKHAASQVKSPAPKTSGAQILDRLTEEESVSVLQRLLEKHPQLRSEAEQIANELMDSPSIESVTDEVIWLVTAVDLEALNERAGRHSWGYVEPSEAAWELLEESLEELVEDMKRRAESGMVSEAETICAGIIKGLYAAEDIDSDGALGWAPDFPAQHAAHITTELFRSIPAGTTCTITDYLADLAPKWKAAIHRAVRESSGKKPS